MLAALFALAIAWHRRLRRCGRNAIRRHITHGADHRCGIILTLTALKNIFGASRAAKLSADEPTTALALMPLAIPGIVTPMGVAIVILFASYFPDLVDRLAILSVIAGIMVANYIAMRISHWFMRVSVPFRFSSSGPSLACFRQPWASR